MEGLNIINYKVKGIKSLDDTIELSFYKKTISKDINFQDYNIKGIYGVNGVGKTSIISSLKLLKDIFLYPTYFSNEFNQSKLYQLINKSTKELDIEVEFIVNFEDMKRPILYRYNIVVALSQLDTYVIRSEKVSIRTATSNSASFRDLIIIENGRFIVLSTNDDTVKREFFDKTNNLLLYSTICSLFSSNIYSIGDLKIEDFENDEVMMSCFHLLCFATSLNIYLDDRDLHHSYIVNKYLSSLKSDIKSYKEYLKSSFSLSLYSSFIISHNRTIVKKNNYDLYSKQIKRLECFLKIFKEDLKCIDIEKKENGDVYECGLTLRYDDYGVYSEFESTGIKKLIDLFQCFQAVMNGEMVFIDELDSNLHDVYLCALLEFLSENAKGQLCFTTHNIGPMDVLKKKKKSIDFLSDKKEVYSWATSGNYSPSTLYRRGLIEGSQFKVTKDSFANVFNKES